MNWIMDNWYWLLPTIISVASMITAATPTPKDDLIFAKIRRLLELLALNVGHAKPIPASKPSDDSGDSNPPSAGSSSLPLQRRGSFILSLWPAWLALAFLMFTAGCGSSPRDYVLLSDTYSATAHGVAAAVRAGAFDDEQLEQIRRLNIATKQTLDEAEQAVIDDNSFTLNDRLTLARGYIDELIRLQLTSKSNTTPETNTPESTTTPTPQETDP